jgi:hypothetical protein
LSQWKGQILLKALQKLQPQVNLGSSLVPTGFDRRKLVVNSQDRKRGACQDFHHRFLGFTGDAGTPYSVVSRK